MLVALAPLVAAQDSRESAGQQSPRAVVRTFLDAMNAVRADRVGALDTAVSCLSLEGIPESERAVAGPKYADQLFDILELATTVPVQSLPDTDLPDQATHAFTVSLPDPEHPEFEVVLEHGAAGTWKISAGTLEQAEKLHTELAPSLAGNEQAANGPALSSPRETMRTFIEGYNADGDEGMEQALAALDLSAIDRTLRQEKGETLAYMLKQVLDRHGKVVYQEIPNDPDGPPYVHLSSRAGKVVIAPSKDPETEQAHWRFTQQTLGTLEEVYEAYRQREVADGVEQTPAAKPLDMAVRDWVADHAPFLMERGFLLRNWQWLGLFVVIIVGMAVSRIAGYLLLLLIRRWFHRADMALSDELQSGFVRPIRVAIMAWVWFLALKMLGLPADTLYYLRIAAATASAIGAVWAAYRLVDILSEYLHERAERTRNKFDDILVPLVGRSLKVFVVVFGIVFVAETAGFDSKSLLAGLGLGGLAFALAAKDTIANIFGSITILLDRPFQIGDWVVMEGVEGSVETVGMRSTRVRTFYNSLITVPNSELINARIDNMGARRFRRIKTTLAITYDTPPERIEAFCEGIRSLIRQHPYTRKDYYHVWFTDFDAASLGILVYCFVETPDWPTEMREKHRLYLDIVRLANRLGVEFAFPTQTLYLRQDQAPEAPSAPESPEDAQVLGRREAMDIVNAYHGGRHAPAPPPVDLTEVPEDAMDLSRQKRQDDAPAEDTSGEPQR